MEADISMAGEVTSDIIMFSSGNLNKRFKVNKINNGNLGIGTTNPSAKLEVVGNINATGNVKLSSTGYIHSGGNVIIRLGTA